MTVLKTEGKSSYARIASIYRKNKFSILEVVKEEKEIEVSCAVTFPNSKAIATVQDTEIGHLL